MDPLHHQIGAFEIAAGDEARHVTAGKPRMDHQLGFIADDAERVLPGQQIGQLHHQRRRDIRPRHNPQRAEPAVVEFLRQAEAADLVARSEPAHFSVAPLEPCGEHGRQASVANLSRRRGHVVGHAHIGQRVLCLVE